MPLCGQAPLTVRDLFDGLPANPRPTAFTRPIRTPLIGSYDLRTESEDFDPTRQEYTLRLNMVSLRRARAQRRYAELLSAPVIDPLAGDYCEIVERRYRDWPDLYLTVRRQRILDTLNKVLDDRSRVASSYAAVGLLRAREQVRIRTDLTDFMLQADELGQIESVLRDRYNLGERSLDLNATISAGEMSTRLLTAGDPGQLARVRRDYRLALIDREMELERAEGKQLLDFLQFRYRSDVRDEVFEKFSIGLAVRIQDSADRRLKLRELEVRRQEIEREGALSDRLDSWREGEEAGELRRSLARYQLQQQLYREEAADLNRLATALTREQAADPEILLDLRERGLRNQLRLLSTLEEVYDNYLDWLGARNEICGATDGGLLLKRTR
jgi:hypothetical protein